MDSIKTETFEMIDMNKHISKLEIEDFLRDKNIQFEQIIFEDLNKTHHNVIITIQSNALAITKLHILSGQSFPNKHDKQLCTIRFMNDINKTLLIPKPLPGEEIVYSAKYDKLFQMDYERHLGEDSMIFINRETIERQRAVFGYLMKKIGLTLFKGRSINDISLPINIFDCRSLLDLWICQNAYAAILLELAGKQTNPIERLKYTTTFAITKFHLSGAQLKPFNPTLGETFQAKINDSIFYLEQTSYHPSITNFYGYGNYYKIYGYNESEASTGANTVKVYYKGDLYVQYPDGTKHYIIYPPIKMNGTMMGPRELRFRGELVVIDDKNDLISIIKLDPDDRGVFEKFSKKKNTYPDYLKGIITSLKNNTIIKQGKYSAIKENKLIYSKIEGEFTKYINFDGIPYWEYSNSTFPKIYRQNYTLPSDSTFREDLHLFKQKEEVYAQKSKLIIEDNQIREKKLRESYYHNRTNIKKY